MVVVESPAKARTIKKYLGGDYLVEASAGHIKDLPKSALGVDVDKDFSPTYSVIPNKKKTVDKLKKAARDAEDIYLAADPDREGEAICQHLAEILSTPKKKRKIFRVLFNEITKNAVQEAFNHPSEINSNKVDAQQARRILDRLVGYKVSPLLWKNVQRGLSAGRVQTVALRLVVDREKEIRAFNPEEYWNFAAALTGHIPPTFQAKAVKLDGKKFKVSNADEAGELLDALKAGEFVVADIRRKEQKRWPVPPFVTSTLQQEASRRMRFTVKKTMTLAQRLYEGIDLGPAGRVGLITYMRTDSARVSDLAIGEAREFIETRYGKPYLPARPPVYKKKKGAQDAHEAIRPTSVSRTPGEVKDFLERDAFKLYELIWKRFVASQMSQAVFDRTEIDVDAPRTLFRAIGSIQKFDGFLRVYQEQKTSDNGDAEGKELPSLNTGEALKVEELTHEQKFTQPPTRYTEAGLVKALEEKGIGRPSTYAQIISVIQSRDYVEKEQRRFSPTEVGEQVSDLLVDNFEEIFDYDYTAKMEKALDEIESGKKEWVATLKKFYKSFSRELAEADERMKKLRQEVQETDIDCEKCGNKMVIRWGRFGRFMACGNYPDCKNTKELKKDNGDSEEAQEAKRKRNGSEKGPLWRVPGLLRLPRV
jgi:DNA topoisomerase-1